MSSTKVQFLTGTKEQIEDHALTEGAIFFYRNENNIGGKLAYDLGNKRYWISSPNITNTSEIASPDIGNSTPAIGDLIVVTDGFTTVDADTGDIIATPALKIGDGETTLANLPYVTDFFAPTIDLLVQHMNNSSIHIKPEERIYWNQKASYSVNADTEVLRIFNIDDES